MWKSNIEAVKAGRTITRIALAFEAGRDGFWLARWLAARGVGKKLEPRPERLLAVLHRWRDARLTLNAGKHAANQPARLAQLDDGNDRAILVQGDEGPAQSLPRRRPRSFGWGIAGTPSAKCSDKVAISSPPAP